MSINQTLHILSEEIVINKIYEIRSLKVMLDSDLAALYGVQTKVLNQAIKRNVERFPADFMFQLTEVEWASLRSQIVTSKMNRGGRTYLPYVFSEHGVLMLSSVLGSREAIQVNIQVVRVLAKLRSFLSDKNELKLDLAEIKKQLHHHDQNIALVFNYLDGLMEKKIKPRRRIGFKPDDL